jgi:hypothetical protein
MSADTDLRDQALAYLRATTSKYSKTLETNLSSNWGKAFAALAKIGTQPVPPPVPVPVPPPVNPYQALTGLCAYTETDLPLIAGMGVRHVRCDFSRATDSWLTTCRTLGLKVTLIADYAMGLGTNGDHSMPSSYPAWSAKVAALVTVYPTTIEAVEVWNEPWLSSFWSPTPDPNKYLQLVESCARAVWACVPDMTILASLDYNANVQVVGFTDHLWRKHILELDTTGFLTDPRIRPSIHCYCQKLAPAENPTDPQNGFQRYEQCYDDLKAHGHPDPQCWVTEYGWESDTAGGWGNFKVTEQQQADYTAQALALMRTSGKVERSHAYFLESSNTWSYSWLRPDNTPKPVVAAVKALLA